MNTETFGTFIDAQVVYDILEKCHTVTTPSDLRTVIDNLRHFVLPHRYAACSFVDMQTQRIAFLVNINFPSDFVKRVVNSKGLFHSPVFQCWSQQELPCFMEVDHIKKSRTNRPNYNAWIGAMRDHDIKNIFAHGMSDFATRMVSYFSFAQLERPPTEQTRKLLMMLVPTLHSALLSAMRHCLLSTVTTEPSELGVQIYHAEATAEDEKNRRTTDRALAVISALLSQREMQIFWWMALGKTNDEIATILNISMYTVKNHIQRILDKLGAENRTQAVAKISSITLSQNNNPEESTISGRQLR